MIVDSNAINDFNPFVVGDMSLPGTFDRPYEYDVGSVTNTIVTKPPTSSPACQIATTAGDNSIDWCTGRKMCKLSRPLYPMRNIDPGFTCYGIDPDVDAVDIRNGTGTGIDLFTILVALAIIFIVFMIMKGGK